MLIPKLSEILIVVEETIKTVNLLQKDIVVKAKSVNFETGFAEDVRVEITSSDCKCNGNGCDKTEGETQ